MDKIVTAEEKSLANAAEVKDTLGTFLDWGHINFESANGVIQSNCKAFEFKSAEEMNTFFKDNASAGMYAAQIFQLSDRIVAICNRTMTEEDQQILADNADQFRTKVQELKKAREDAKLAEEADLKARVEKLEALQKLGEKCEKNHGAVIEDNKKYKSENEALRKQVTKYQKAEAKR